MAISQVDIASPSALNQFIDSSMTNAVDGVKASSAVVYSVFIDNSANAGAASYVKLFNVASGSVSVGVTSPDEVIYVPQGVVVEHLMFTGVTPGKTFGTALSAICVTTGGTVGNTGPSSSVKVTINYV